ncbi:hypothetical protein JYU34_003046 [Plutella xylostella]|uniref:Uncharacterized protein n=1 Tax=Plutella xylostella TaxID=51655 RepID=A0ABQ7QZ23_PLUXY|nr:hypothetical protein JYU34_003046 [Plutella xylostella]
MWRELLEAHAHHRCFVVLNRRVVLSSRHTIAGAGDQERGVWNEPTTGPGLSTCSQHLDLLRRKQILEDHEKRDKSCAYLNSSEIATRGIGGNIVSFVTAPRGIFTK